MTSVALRLAAGWAVGLSVAAIAPAAQPEAEEKPAGQIDAQTRREIAQMRLQLRDLRARALDIEMQLAIGEVEDEGSMQDELAKVQDEILILEEGLILRGVDPDSPPEPDEEDKQEIDQEDLDARRAAAIAALRAQPEQPRQPAEGEWIFGPFAEPVELTTILDLVQDELGLNLMYADTGLQGQQVVIRTPITLPRERLLDFTLKLLDEKNYTMTRDLSGVWTVQQKATITGDIATDAFATTQIISTKGLRPSALQAAISAVVGQQGVTPVYLDEIGAIIATGSPRAIAQIRTLIDEIVDKSQEVQWRRIDLQYVASDVARTRVLELMGSVQQRPQQQAQPGQQQVAPVVPGQSIVDLPQRLTIDPQSNALFFRGRPDEELLLREMLEVIDVPNTLVSRWYPVGAQTADKVARAGEAQGLGSVTYESGSQPGLGRTQRGNQPAIGQFTSQSIGGAGFFVYPEESGFMYNGTDAQHQRVEELVFTFSSLSEEDVVVYEFYKLKHSDAEEVAGIIRDLIANTLATGNRGLVGQDLSRREPNANAEPGQEQPDVEAVAAEGGIAEIVASEDINIIQDEFNNQIVVKAPRKLQPQFARVIQKLDLKRPQVYLEAMIVTVTHDDNFRFAVETQLMFGQFGMQTVFGLTSPTEGADFFDQRSINNGLQGLTAALVRSDSIPFVINAIAQDADTRIVARPQLLVDDNEEATILSQEGQPTTSVNQGTATTQTSFQGFEEAGPELTITPHISEGGYVRLELNITLSSFIGDSTEAGVPPPRLRNEVSTASVRVPTDSTIVIGGLSFTTKTDSKVKIPLLGDLPLVGYAFSDTRKVDSTTTLYVFITPRIMRDDTFRSELLNTEIPAAIAGIDTGPPPPQPVRIESLGSPPPAFNPSLEEEIFTTEPESR